MIKYIKYTIREFIGLKNDYESLLLNQEQILEKLQHLEKLEVMNQQSSYYDYLILKNLMWLFVILGFFGGDFWLYNTDFFNNSVLESIKSLGILSKDLQSLNQAANNFPINEDDLYQVGNIFLYTITNIDIEGLNLRDVIQHLRAYMVMYNTDQIVNILQNQLEERTEEFIQQVVKSSKNFICRNGFNNALTTLGLPPVGGVIARTLSNVSNNPSSYATNDIVKLRDVWDASLKKILDIIFQ